MATTQTIRTEPLSAQPRWTSLSGTILEGGYELQDLLEATDTEARFKVRVLGDRELESVASLFQISDAETGRQVELWQRVRMLRHPNLSAPLGAGRLQLDGVPLAYVVLRRADEALAAVLRERPLTAEEAGETFTSAARALEALHLNGWAHGCLSPDLVLAVGDYIQLPVECVRTAGIAPVAETTAAKYLAPESVRVNLTPEADLWCLGATLFEALTQKRWTEESRKELEALPEPFATIAFRCLETSPEARCSLAEAVALYRGELKLPPRVRTAAEPSIIIPQQEIAATPEPPFAQPNGHAPSQSLPSAAEPRSEKQPKTKLLVENTTGTIETPELRTSINPEVAAIPAASSGTMAPSVSTAQPSATDGVGSNIPKAAAMAALAPEAEARAIGAPSSSPASASNPDTYTEPKPSVVARPNREETRRRSTLDEEGGSTNKIWLWAGLLLLVVVALIWFLRPRHQAPAPVSNLNSKPNLPAAGQSNGSAWQTHTLGPSTAKPGEKTLPAGSAAHSRNTAAKPAVSSGAPAATKPGSHPQTLKTASVPEGPALKGNVWRVILYTYNRLPDAEKRAKDINARHSGLHAEVFSPSGGGSPYLVTTGGRLTREEALQARRKAIGVGMARDAYIQNYSR